VTRRAAKATRARREPPTEAVIFERVLASIFEHRLPPGTKLGEEQLAAIFGVSRARIRRVLPRLAHEGVVTLEPNRGAFVAKPTIADALEVFEARKLIEPGIVARLLARPDRKGIAARLKQHVAAERRARAEGDTRSTIRLSGEFHILLAEMAGNARLSKIMRELATLTCLIIALYDKPSVPHCISDEHADIVAAIVEGSPARTAKLMIAHLDHVQHGLDLSLTESAPVDLQSALT
jgi:DNA-binding GntR family transcriptional regulator